MSTPKISVNKLGEYLEAHPARRKKIVYDAKYPQAYITTRYGVARDGIKTYINSGYDAAVLTQVLADVSAKGTSTDFQQQDKDLSIEVLRLMQTHTLPDFSGLTIEDYNGNNPKMLISGVEVSIYPDLVLRGQKRGVDFIGIVKIHLSKSNKLTEEGGKYISTLLAAFAQNHVATNPNLVSLPHCISIDAFTGGVQSAPTSIMRRMERIEAACEEIALWWERV